MMTRMPSPPFIRRDETPDSRPLCQKPPSPMTAIGRFCWKLVTAAAFDARLMPIAEDRVAEAERREGRERVAADVGGVVHLADFALGQFQRGEKRPLRTTRAECRRARRHGPPMISVAVRFSSARPRRRSPGRRDCRAPAHARCTNLATPASRISEVYSPAIGNTSLPASFTLSRRGAGSSRSRAR